MKITYAWLLLVLALSNWVGGFVYVEMSCLVEIRHDMNAAEQVIAESVAQEIGTENVVKMLDEQQVNPKGNVYGDFAFATEMAGKTVYYTFLNSATDVKKVAQHPDKSSSSDENHALLLKSLLTEFEVIPPNYLLRSVLISYQSNFLYSDLKGHIFTTIFTPPPDYI